MNESQFTGAKESRQLIRVAAIGLYLVGSLLRNERRGDDLADQSLVAQMAADDETARAGFVSKAQLDIFRSEFLDPFVDGVQRAADNAVTAERIVPERVVIVEILVAQRQAAEPVG